MHWVKRSEKPQSLVDNAEQWTTDLLAQIALHNNEFSKVPKSYTDKYRQKDVRDKLDQMYNGLCCFCESLIGHQTYERIEHLKPKSKFPDQCFEWKNLNYSCEICNSMEYKGIKWDYQSPILDPTDDDIDSYLKIDLDTAEIIAIDDNLRGKTTIEHTGLNRENLIAHRKKIIKHLLLKTKKNSTLDIADLIEVIESASESMGYPLLFKTYISKLKLTGKCCG